MGSLFKIAGAVPDIEIRPNAVYTLAEVCQIFRTSDSTVRRLLKLGILKSGRVGRSYRFLGSQLLDALYPSTTHATPNPPAPIATSILFVSQDELMPKLMPKGMNASELT